MASHDIGPLTPASPAVQDLQVIADAPTELAIDERMFLYSIVRGTEPQRVLEIGTSRGGSALIIAQALQDNGVGQLAGIDPLPRIEPPLEAFHGRFHLVTGTSPEAVPEASERVGGQFDLVFIDGIHIYTQAGRDLEGALPFMAPQGYVLFHDSFHFGVSEAIREAVEKDATLHDCGYVCCRPRRVGDLLTHAGLRLVRRGPAVVDMTPLVSDIWAQAGQTPPHDPDLRDHDIWYCTAVEACSYCKRREAFSQNA